MGSGASVPVGCCVAGPAKVKKLELGVENILEQGAVDGRGGQ